MDPKTRGGEGAGAAGAAGALKPGREAGLKIKVTKGFEDL